MGPCATLLLVVVANAVVLAGASSPSPPRTCEEVVQSLNERWLNGSNVGENRFVPTAPDDGARVQDELKEWLSGHGLIVRTCRTFGSNVSKCFDGAAEDFVAASWVGLSDTLREKIEADLSPPFPYFSPLGMMGIGLVLDPSHENTEILCSYPGDANSIFRQDRGCGPLRTDFHHGTEAPSVWSDSTGGAGRRGFARYPQPTLAEVLDFHRNGGEDANFMMDNFKNAYQQAVSTWDIMNWKVTGRTWENFTCMEAWTTFDGVAAGFAAGGAVNANTTAFGPAGPSMEACQAYVRNASSVFDDSLGKRGSAAKWYSTGSWEDPTVEILGHEMCQDDASPCASESGCTSSEDDQFYWYVGPCSWPPDQFQTMLDGWDEIRRYPLSPSLPPSLSLFFVSDTRVFF